MTNNNENLKDFDVTVSWTVSKKVKIKAKSEEEAETIANRNVDTSNGEYVEDSFVVDSIEESNQ